MTKKKEDEKLKSIKEITDDVIDLAIDGMYSEIETWRDEDGAGHQINLSPKPELYDKLNQYFAEIMKDMLVMVLKNQFNQPESKAPGR